MASAGTAYVDIEAKLDSLASDVDDAVAAIDTQTIDVETVADTSSAQSEIDSVEGGSAEIEVQANTEQAQANIDDLSGALSSAGDAAGLSGGSVGGFGSELAGLAGASAGVTAGLSLVAGGLLMAGDAAGEAQVVAAETDSILGSLGSSAVTTADHISDLSQRIMEYSGFSDEAVQAGANTLLMFDNINNEATFDRAIEGAADLARRMNTDVPQAARMLGLALQDPEAGMNRLRRAGIVLSDSQKESISTFMAVGDTASAQQVILDSLEGRIGNLAEDYGSTMRGGMDQAREAMDNLAETAGQSLLPIMDALSASVIDQIDRLNSWDNALNGALLSGPIQAIFGGGGSGLDVSGSVIGQLPAALDASTAATDAFADASGRAKDEIDGLSNTLHGYLDGAFAVPEAQRNLEGSFRDLFGVLLTQGHTADDVAAALEGVAYSTADLGAANGNFAGTADTTIQRLRGMRDAGQLSAEEFDRVRDAIRGAQDQAPLTVPVSTPGADGAIRSLQQVKTTIDGIDRTVVVQVSVPNLGAIAADVAGAAAALRSLRNESGAVFAGDSPTLVDARNRSPVASPVATSSHGGVRVGQIVVNAPSGNGDDIARVVSDELRKLERAAR